MPDTFSISENNYNTILAVSSSTNNTGPFYQNKVVEYIKFGDNVEIQVNVNFSDQYLVPSRYNSSFFLRNAYGEFFEIKPEYEPKLKRDGEEEESKV